MRIVYGNSANPYWYSEAGAISWGFGVEIQHYGEPSRDDEDEGAVIPQGWSIDFYVGPWLVSVFSEAGARSVFGKSLQYMGTVSQI